MSKNPNLFSIYQWVFVWVFSATNNWRNICNTLLYKILRNGYHSLLWQYYLIICTLKFINIIVDASKNKYPSSNDRNKPNTSSSSDRHDKYRNPGLEFNPKIHSEKPDKVFLIKKFQDSQRQVEMERPNMEVDRRTSAGYSHTSSSSKRGIYDHSKSNSLYSKETGTLIDHSHSASTSNSAHNRARTRRDSEGTRSHHGHLTPRKHGEYSYSAST